MSLKQVLLSFRNLSQQKLGPPQTKMKSTLPIPLLSTTVGINFEHKKPSF